MITLSDLFAEFPFSHSPLASIAVPVTGISADSRRVEAGNLFVATCGSTLDGHAFIPEALANGAAAVVGEQPLPGLAVPYVQVENSRQALAHLAAAFYGHPARRLTMIGITGTDGKTTTANLIFQILTHAGIKAGMISTVNAVVGDQVLDTGFHVTTPDAPDVQRYLAMMVASGLTHVVLETTSHGWAQYRVDACEFDIGIVTNITHEHLDYHGSFENYRAAKARLFFSLGETHLKPQGNPRLSILNRDDASYEYLTRLTPGPRVGYGLDEASELFAEAIDYDPDGITFTAVGRRVTSLPTAEFRVPVKTALVGAFNVSNCLAALATAVYGLGLAPELGAEGIAVLEGVPGRMERIDLGQPFTAIVDFAHTPNALRVAIHAVRGMTQKRVIVVFGSAGLRDRAKRRLMAEAAVELADLTILTAEDPRSESLADILAEMADGARSKGGMEGRTFWRVPDRGEAIRHGVQMASVGDVLIVCGKGHEQSMCFGTTEYPWDDRTALRAALAELLGLEGPPMPSLPTRGKT